MEPNDLHGHSGAGRELCGLIFVNLDPDTPPLRGLLGDLPARLAPYRLDTLEPFAGVQSPGQPANWKVIVENYIEGYHIPIAHPGLMRLLDYKRYDAEIHEHWVWFEAPMRAKPSSNRLERLYSRLVEPMPGLSEEDRHVWRYVFIYPNTTIGLYADQVGTWQVVPDGVGRSRDVLGAYRAAQRSARTRAAQWLNVQLNKVVADEDVDLVANVQLGARTRGHRCGPLSPREAAVGWFADRIRADLSPVLDGR